MINTTIYSPMDMMERMLKNTTPVVHKKSYYVDEKDDSFIVEIPVPGFKNEQVSVEVNGNFLVVEGKDSDSYWAEDFEKKFKLPSDVNPDKIKASIQDGVLIVDLSKRKESLPKRIKIS